VSPEQLRERAWAAASGVADPELPVLTIAELGILRDVRVDEGGTVEVAITPTYTGCPATAVIALDVVTAMERAGITGCRVRTVLSPPWTSDWLTPEGRRKLVEAGIAPPACGVGTARAALFAADPVACPRCGGSATERLAEFGATACKALYRCRSCGEPFEHFKCL